MKILPNRPADGQPAIIEIHDTSPLESDTCQKEAEDLRAFPGPLIKGETHKNDVLAFCSHKARECRDSIEMVDRESAVLLWRYLELLIKQNGIIVGTDVAELLLEGHEPTTQEYSQLGLPISQSVASDLGSAGNDSELNVTTDRSFINRNPELTVESITDRFRHLSLYGRKKDALEWAMKNKLWGHALFLSYKMDTRTHANVMIR